MSWGATYSLLHLNLCFVNFHNVFVEIVSSLDYFPLFFFVIVVIVVVVVGQHIEIKRK